MSKLIFSNKQCKYALTLEQVVYARKKSKVALVVFNSVTLRKA
mgnify:CR=1 FL=1